MSKASLDFAHHLLDIVKRTAATRAADKVRLATAAISSLQNIECENHRILRALVAVNHDSIAKAIRHETSDVSRYTERIFFAICNLCIKENRIFAVCGIQSRSKSAHAHHHFRARIAEERTFRHGVRICSKASNIHRILEFYNRLCIKTSQRKFCIAAFARKAHGIGLHADAHRFRTTNLYACKRHRDSFPAFVVVRILFQNRHFKLRSISLEFASLDEFLGDRDFSHRIFGKRHANRIGKAIEQKRTNACSRLQTSISTCTRLRHAHMERIRLKVFLLQASGKQAISRNGHTRIARLEAQDHLIKMFGFANRQIFNSAFHHAFNGVAISINHTGAQGTVVHANADSTAKALRFLHKRSKSFGNLFLAFFKRPVRLLVKRQNTSIYKVTRVDADLFHPLERFESGLRLEVDIGRNRNRATGSAYALHDFFKSSGIGKRRSRNTYQTATDLSEGERFRYSLFDILRLGGRHGLN